jgi:hypothetical protein
MNITDIIAWVSLFVGIGSLAVSGYTIWLARETERETRESFRRQEDRMQQQYERTKDLLAQVDSKAQSIDQSVKGAQERLLDTVTGLINQAYIPKKPDAGEQMGLMFLQAMLQNPDGADKMAKAMQPLIELGQKAQHEKK